MSVTVLVPGYGGRLRVVERWRMKVAHQTLAARGGGRLVLSGYAGEADRLAALAMPGASLVTEPNAQSTFENVQRSLPYLCDTAQVAIASDRFHRRRITRYLRVLDPEVPSRLVSPDYGWREGWWMDAAGAAYELLLRLRRPWTRGPSGQL